MSTPTVFWGDFIIDDILGPILFVPDQVESCREGKTESTSTRMDAKANRETGLEQRSARMVDQPSSFLATHMDVGSDSQSLQNSRRKGHG